MERRGIHRPGQHAHLGARPEVARGDWRERIFGCCPLLADELAAARGLEAARDVYMAFLGRERRHLAENVEAPAIPHSTALACLRVLESLASRRNERRVGFSVLQALWQVSRGSPSGDITDAFVTEIEHLFLGLALQAPHLTDLSAAAPAEGLSGREAALERSANLDALAVPAIEKMEAYATGLRPEVVESRRRNQQRIMGELGATEADWADWTWQLRNTVRTLGGLERLVVLSQPEREAVRRAKQMRLPLAATPYHLSLLDEDPQRGDDHSLRWQVFPPLSYVDCLSRALPDSRQGGDFMGEGDTSPVDLITRRYPMICILKPYTTCAQICVYCQRNWEIRDPFDEEALAGDETIEAAVDYIRRTESLREVLLTGGDPLLLPDERLRHLLERVAAISHVERIRVGTRTPVVIPQRITGDLADILASFREPGRREVCVMTHFQHAYEVTPEAARACQLLREHALPVYNQMVFTTQNARRFEAAALRRALRLIGVDPYYTFCAKAKPETQQYRVPIARILQERREEARLLPGIVRTDEPVFNVPRLGKTHLRASQDRQLIAIMPDGSRAYEFHPWEKNLREADSYIYHDIPIAEFLGDMEARGESAEEYRSIHYYF